MAFVTSGLKKREIARKMVSRFVERVPKTFEEQMDHFEYVASLEDQAYSEAIRRRIVMRSGPDYLSVLLGADVI